ncbi:uncharacterized protein K452DRAFT_286205 [Aplosporella prunicola CBS 121167]|uniref:DUF4484 domain-containing protein n=1 Tax=Aplosporella prunicola CBS 121167 TaxID=1176127 RepID=A0A6A6BGV9_9PEZI|nr:uncharacterized protein K452DRAFT_286205 [Aplosporella prunicola CBS 121167]KAF2143379.1 hypothetical protein K452DRAFT_286205 [Aplosporella prunicola CBS 121167]
MSADVVQSNGNAANGEGLPPLAALFLIKFDLKIGYTVSWKRSLPGVDLDGAVEFKSLPSGLHSVKEDLVYFIHEQYVGLSSFINGPASEEERNAHLVAVGILVPLSQGRLGRSWLHAQNLNELARLLVNDTTQTDILEEYWASNNAANKQESQDAESLAPSSSRSPPKATRKSSSYGRSRGLSNVTAFHPKHETLGAAHPALSIMKYIDTFGPLVFPLVRAALLRKRILFITPPPVRLACEFVYDLCILSTIPSSVTDALPPGSEPLQRLRSLFAVGVHDIPRLEEEAVKHDRARDTTDYSDEDGWSPGWAACSTDEVLAMKTNLYDIVVELPVQADSSSPQEKCWPRIKDFRGKEIKATQRDLRRFRILHHELRKTQRSSVDIQRNEDEDESDDGDQAALLNSPAQSNNTAGEEEIYADSIVEPYTWSELAYAGFMWWASAGEQDTSQSEEGDRDRALLGDLSDFVAMSPGIRQNSFDADTMAQSWYNTTGSSAPHTAIIAYFHRLTGEVFHALADIVDAADDEEDDMDDEREKRKVEVHGEDVRRMGLDGWSEVDKAFVKEVLKMYFGRRAEVHGASVECCGIKIC